MSYLRHERYFCTLYFLNFSHLGFVSGDNLIPVLHLHNGWSSRGFNNMCKFEIPHFFTLVIFCKCNSCWSNFFRYVHYHLSGLNNSLCFRVNRIARPCHVHFVRHYGVFFVFCRKPLVVSALLAASTSQLVKRHNRCYCLHHPFEIRYFSSRWICARKQFSFNATKSSDFQ